MKSESLSQFIDFQVQQRGRLCNHRIDQNPLVTRSTRNYKGQLETKRPSGRNFIVHYLKLPIVEIPLEESMLVALGSGLLILTPLILYHLTLKISFKSLAQAVQPWWPGIATGLKTCKISILAGRLCLRSYRMPTACHCYSYYCPCQWSVAFSQIFALNPPEVFDTDNYPLALLVFKNTVIFRAFLSFS